MEWIVVAALVIFLGGLGLILREIAIHEPKQGPTRH
jgi:hypothetical protein